MLKNSLYEPLNNQKPEIRYLRALGCKYFVLNNDKDDFGKFDPKSDEGVFVLYLLTNKAYKIFNKRTLCVKNGFHVIFDELGSMEDLRYKDDAKLKELFHIQRDLLNDEVSRNHKMKKNDENQDSKSDEDDNPKVSK